MHVSATATVLAGEMALYFIEIAHIQALLRDERVDIGIMGMATFGAGCFKFLLIAKINELYLGSLHKSGFIVRFVRTNRELMRRHGFHVF